MTTKELILQKLDLVPEPVLRAILQLLDAYTQPAAPQAPNTWFDNFFTEIVGGWSGPPLERPNPLPEDKRETLTFGD
ncbi:MAG: hypothetical protein AAF889_07325 [Cyanobacteria bacterium P01_D01_bin.73]